MNTSNLQHLVKLIYKQQNPLGATLSLSNQILLSVHWLATVVSFSREAAETTFCSIKMDKLGIKKVK